MIRVELLKSLANHLKTGELSTEVFDFSKYDKCAMHECPAVWPKTWYLNEDGLPLLFRSANDKTYSCGREYFGLNTAAYDHLFIPTMQKPDLFGGQVLQDEATRYQVADNILAFCDKVDETKTRLNL